METCNPSHCPIAGRVDRLEEQLDEAQTLNTQSHKEIFGRVSKLEQASAANKAHYDAIISQLRQIASDVAQLKSTPAKRWELLVTSALSALASGITVFFLSQGGVG